MDAVEVALQSIDALGPETAELREPFVNFLQRLGFDAVEAALCVDGGLNESSVAQHAQVLGDGRLRHAQLALDVADGLLGGDEQAEDGAAVGFRNDGECRFHSFYIRLIAYTCQGIFKKYFRGTVREVCILRDVRDLLRAIVWRLAGQGKICGTDQNDKESQANHLGC